MKVIMFQPRFAALIQAGTKTTTIRPVRKRRIEVDDILSLRRWKGKPYRSKQEWLATYRCRKVERISIYSIPCCSDPLAIFLGGRGLLSKSASRRLALKDGFSSANEMAEWFIRNHGWTVFRGVRIHWKPNA